MPELPGYAMHGSFLPASLTGGDTYDLAHTSQGLLVVLESTTGIEPRCTVEQPLSKATAVTAGINHLFT